MATRIAKTSGPATVIIILSMCIFAGIHGIKVLRAGLSVSMDDFMEPGCQDYWCLSFIEILLSCERSASCNDVLVCGCSFLDN